MSAQKKGLGKGLSALFGDIKTKKDNNHFQKNIVAISDLQRNKYQPRTFFDEAKLEELSMSIKENGIVQPIAVRVNKFEVGKFEIVAGERRWLAAQKAGLNKVPVVVLDIDDQKTLEIAIIENVQREDLNIIDEAKGYQRLNQEYQDRIAKHTSTGYTANELETDEETNSFESTFKQFNEILLNSDYSTLPNRGPPTLA